VIIGGAIGWSGASALLVTRRRSRTDELDDLATWVETLRDNVFARQGLLGAIEATESSAPASLRPKIAALVARVRSGLSLDRALVALAHDFGDGAVDDVIAPLVLASRIGGPDLHAILSAAAVRTREQLAITLHAEVARAKPRREMRTIAIATVVLVVATMAIGHKYFAPFATPIGQVVLVGIAMLFAAGFMMMNRLARPTPSPRLFEEVVS
jgi:tight adherence protein B